MPGDAAATRRVAVVVGLPMGIRAPLEQRFRGHVVVRPIMLRQDGGFRLGPPPTHAARLVEQFADEATSYADVLIILLPYTAIPKEVAEIAGVIADLGATVLYPKPASPSWPPRSPRLDKKFQDELLSGLVDALDNTFREPQTENPDDEVAFQLLRGLASHSKMGPNNHSHEDDLWKSRGSTLGPGGRERIIGQLLGRGILGRKKNDSAGGKGWVYWIADVAKAKAAFPRLVLYLE